MKPSITRSLEALSRKERRTFFLLLSGNIFLSLCDIAGLALMVFTVSLYASGGFGKTNLWGIRVPPVLAASPLLTFFILLMLFSAKNWLGYLNSRAQSRLMASVASRISRRKLCDYLTGDYAGYVEGDSSALIRDISYYPLEFCQYILGGMLQVVTQAALILLAVTGILMLNTKLFLLLMLLLCPSVIFVFRKIKKHSTVTDREARLNGERSLQYLQEALNGYVESNLYYSCRFFLDRYSHSQRRYNQAIADYLVLQDIPGKVIEIFALSGLFVFMAINQLSGNGKEVVATMAAFIAAAYRIIPGCVKLIGSSSQIRAHRHVTSHLPPGGAAQEPAEETPSPQRITRLAVHHASFRYGDAAVLEDISFQVTEGDFVGISGPSGQGKSTFLHLITGLLRPDSGMLTYNGRVLSVANMSLYRASVAYVQQRPFVIKGTILDNASLGNELDTDNINRILRATGLAGGDGAGPAPGYQIGEHGKNLSGGQRQRVALARGLAKTGASLFILDEPFSELDESTELVILDYLKTLAAEGKIILLVSHHQRSFCYCNKLFSIHGNRLETLAYTEPGVSAR